MQASSLPDEQTLVRLVVAKRQSTVARFSQDRTCLTAQGLLTGAWRIVGLSEVILSTGFLSGQRVTHSLLVASDILADNPNAILLNC